MRKTATIVILAGTLAAAAAGPSVVATGTDPDRDGETGPLPLAAAQQIYVMTDKPLYRPGETIWFRAWEVDTSLAMIKGDHGVTVQLVDPRGGIAIEKRVQSRTGSAHNDLALPTSLAGGRYLVRVTSDAGGSEDRAVTISTYEVPRLKQTLEFARRGYAAGDEVTATLTVLRSTGEPARGARVMGMVVVDGADVARPQATVGRTGKVTLSFTLPSTIGKGDGLLTAVVTDGGASESIQRRIPIETGVVAIAFYPEGGDLIAGLESRIYFSAASPLGAPVDVSGRILDDTGAQVGTFASTFRGRGVLSLVPAAGRRYQAIVDRPATGAAPLAMPVARDRGCVLSVPTADSVRVGDLEVIAACSTEQAVTAVATLRGRELARVTAAASTPTPIRLGLGSSGQGAIRLTLLGKDGVPIAERLVYRKLGADLRVTVTADRDEYAPREPVKLTVETRDAAGNPVAADVALAVVDDAVIALADDRSARIKARLYLEPEMPGQTIDDPNFYFSADPKAPAALDLVLGTQGWRRFRTK